MLLCSRTFCWNSFGFIKAQKKGSPEAALTGYLTLQSSVTAEAKHIQPLQKSLSIPIMKEIENKEDL